MMIHENFAIRIRKDHIPMQMGLPSLQVFRILTRDGRLLFFTRCTRLFAYGLLAVILVLYLHELGLREAQIGTLITLTLLGDIFISLWLTTSADRVGRRKMLIAGALLMILAGVVFAVTSNFWLLVLAATIGVISPSGNEIGPFLPIEQAGLSQTVPDERRTEVFAWYNLIGSVAMALGSLCGGGLVQFLQTAGWTGASSYRPLVIAYGCMGILLALAFTRLSPATEARKGAASTDSALPRRRFGLHRSRRVVLQLASLFALDAFGGGFVVQSIVAYWFFLRFHVDPAVLGSIFFGANLLAGLSSLVAAWLARRIGLLNTMVFTHLPSNVVLILVPLMPDLWWAAGLLLLRFSISQMDVPARQSYTVAVVSPDERSAASGVTGVARSVGAAFSPMLALVLLGVAPLVNVPFFLAGGLKIVYDLVLWRQFTAIRPPEEGGA
jgi:MFS family permease